MKYVKYFLFSLLFVLPAFSHGETYALPSHVTFTPTYCSGTIRLVIYKNGANVGTVPSDSCSPDTTVNYGSFGIVPSDTFGYVQFSSTDPNYYSCEFGGDYTTCSTNFGGTADGYGEFTISPTLGCTDSGSFNYNSSATYDDGSCVDILYGCTDPEANNYDPAANTDDSSCDYDEPVATSTLTESSLGSLNFGIAIIIGLFTLFFVAYIYNQMKPKKAWQK